MKKVCVITGSRAEYGLLKRIMKLLKEDQELELQLIVTGMHTTEKYGNTYQQITKDGFDINKLIKMNLEHDSSESIITSCGKELIEIGKAYNQLNPDLVIVLGDRYEILIAVYAALIFKIPVAHLCGGDITELAYDDSIRHAITKMSHLHFTTNMISSRRVIQMGESPDRVFCYGNPGLEDLISYQPSVNLEKKLGIEFNKLNFLMVFHPTTLITDKLKSQLDIIKDCLIRYLSPGDCNLFIIMPNSDNQNNLIIEMFNQIKSQYQQQCYIFKSLERSDYLSLADRMNLMIGNSSSGIYEMPILKVPVVNLGDRQKGRFFSNGVINTPIDYQTINNNIERALKINRSDIISEYPVTNSSELIVNQIKKKLQEDNLIIKLFQD